MSIATDFRFVEGLFDDMNQHFDCHIVSQFQSVLCVVAVPMRWRRLQPAWNMFLKYESNNQILIYIAASHQVYLLCMCQRKPWARGTFGVGWSICRWAGIAPGGGKKDGEMVERKMMRDQDPMPYLPHTSCQRCLHLVQLPLRTGEHLWVADWL